MSHLEPVFEEVRSSMAQSADQASLESALAKTLGAYDARSDTNAVRFALASPSRGWSWVRSLEHQ